MNLQFGKKNKMKEIIDNLINKYPFITDAYICIPNSNYFPIFYIEIKKSNEVLFKLQNPEYLQKDLYNYALNIFKKEYITGIVHLKILT